MRQELFRREALDFNREKSLGDVVLTRPLSFSLLTLVAVGLALAVVAFAVWGQYTRKAHVTGYLAPDKGLIKIYAPAAGTLVEKHVREGDSVKQGDTLFVLSTERSSREAPQAQAAGIAKLKERRASLEREVAKQAAIDAIESRAGQERVRALETERAQLDAEIRIQQQRVASAQTNVARYRKLVAEKFISEAQAQQRTDELLEQQARVQNLLRSRTAMERDIHSVRRELAADDLRAHNQRGATEREIAALEQELTELESRRTIVITAPADGVATAILAERGQSAAAQMPLLSILPAGATLEAQLLVPSRAMGFIVSGQSVALRYQPFPYQRFGSHKGRVTEISRTLITPNDGALPVPLQEPVYRVTVALEAQSVRAYGETVPLQSGMLLEADVWLDHRRIIEWIFDPLLSVARKV